eukprot:11389370-Karenia_brevis.AAC.1
MPYAAGSPCDSKEYARQGRHVHPGDDAMMSFLPIRTSWVWKFLSGFAKSLNLGAPAAHLGSVQIWDILQLGNYNDDDDDNDN